MDSISFTFPGSHLCDLCDQLEKALFRPATYAVQRRVTRLYRSSSHHLSSRDLEKSAIAGCDFCKLLWHGMLDTYLRRHPNAFKSLRGARDELLKEDSKTGWDNENLWGFGRFRVTLYEDCETLDPSTTGEQQHERQNGFHYIQIERQNTAYGHHPVFIIGTQPSEDDLAAKNCQVFGLMPKYPCFKSDLAFSEGNFHGRLITREPNFGLARAWIDECRELHQCAQLRGCGRSPTRLICISTPYNPHTGLKLIETGGQSYAYVCLSYRWSSSLMCTTTMENYVDRREKIEWESLPATLRDAVHTTSLLGYNYLWIDALCIIQNDPCDWQAECPRMAAIFAGAEVTISAPAAGDSDSAFLVPRFSGYQAPSCALRYRDHDGTVSGRITVWYPALPAEFSTLKQFEPSVLDTRGWILQERIMSSRILYFGSRQLYFECNHHTRHEMLWCSTVSSDNEQLVLGKSIKPGWTKEEVFQWWRYTAADFAARRLTVPEDKLPALSGIASVVNQITGSEYLAGLWRDDLANGLVWETNHNHYQADHSLMNAQLPYRAPSWSWARSDCGSAIPMLENGTKLDKVMLRLEVLSTNIQLAGEDPFGHVRSGSLVIRGKVRRGMIRWVDDGGWDDDLHLGVFDPEHADKPIPFFHDSPGLLERFREVLDQTDEEDFPEDNYVRSQRKDDLHIETDTMAGSDTEVLTLLVSQSVDETYDTKETCGLVLMPANEESIYSRMGIYSRVGLTRESNRLKVDEESTIETWFKDAEEKTITII